MFDIHSCFIALILPQEGSHGNVWPPRSRLGILEGVLMDLFSRPSPESSRRHSVSLCEAVLDSASAYKLVPEKYHKHLDELRENIRAFCKEFGIPNEALRNVEAFGAALKSSIISQKRMVEAVLLFRRLEYLVTNKEPLQEAPPEYLVETERLYHLREQYDSQVTLLERLGILEHGAILGIDGHKYPIPTLEQIAQRLYEQREKLETKQDQGFIKLLLVPFGMSLNALIDTLKIFLRSYKQEHENFDLNTHDSVWIWEDGYLDGDVDDPPKIFYYPKFFDVKKHGGRAKRQILHEQVEHPDSFFPGWTIHLFQPSDPTNLHSKGFAPIPRRGEGKTYGKENPRFDLEAGKRPKEYLPDLLAAQTNEDSPYFQESGLTPEDWIIAFMTHLIETGQPLNDRDKKENASYLIGSVICSSWVAFVPHGDWDSDQKRVELGSRGGPGCFTKDFGIRTSVIV